MSKYLYLDIVPDALDSGRPLAFGDEVTLDQKAVEANQRLVDAGKLVAQKNRKSQEGTD